MLATKRLSVFLLVLAPVLAMSDLRAQTPQVQVRGVMGSASYGPANSTTSPLILGKGAAVPIGAVVKTGPGSAVDLAFSHNMGVVRVLQNSTLSLDKFSVPESSAPGAIELQLNLMAGTMAGFGQKPSPSARCQIKVAHGIADVSGAKYRLDAQGYLVLLEGTAMFVLVPPSGEPVPFELKAPRALYFSPVEGVRAAPDELVREVTWQMKGQLRKR